MRISKRICEVISCESVILVEWLREEKAAIVVKCVERIHIYLGNYVKIYPVETYGYFFIEHMYIEELKTTKISYIVILWVFGVKLSIKRLYFHWLNNFKVATRANIRTFI